MTTLSQVVKDWGGFEDLVADLHRTGTVLVERDVTLIGRSGATRQIDVLITLAEPPYVYKTVVECKYWSSRIKRMHVDIVAATVEDLNAAKGVMFTTVGYQAGALKYAESKGIKIFVVRDLSDEEWGLPGRVVDLYLQIWSRTVLDFQIPTATLLHVGPSPADTSARLGLALSHKPEEWTTSTRRRSGEPWKPLEQIVYDTSLEALQTFVDDKTFLLEGDAKSTAHIRQTLQVDLPLGCMVSGPQGSILFEKCRMELVHRVTQSRMTFDRGTNFDYALAVVDCVTGHRLLAARKNGADTATWQSLPNREPPEEEQEEALKNGSVIKMTFGPYFSPRELPVEFRSPHAAKPDRPR